MLSHNSSANPSNQCQADFTFSVRCRRRRHRDHRGVSTWCGYQHEAGAPQWVACARREFAVDQRRPAEDARRGIAPRRRGEREWCQTVRLHHRKADCRDAARLRPSQR